MSYDFWTCIRNPINDPLGLCCHSKGDSQAYLLFLMSLWVESVCASIDFSDRLESHVTYKFWFAVDSFELLS